ncbi:DUF6984 family protein [Flectobacillus sp. BAB-3569]|uniref:DUF6984 family protein n=1 Tax=Flectobacillus sp. BAB-3569 TaxID=1509483 RepID=UPI000BA2D87C|nr:hypothetical protein [Flectobacillus sp. BAB-3569]PAC31729.1 hypothetical protein BWI92_08600 [Flectobacillus sp. BAB-3569]
MSQDTRKIRPQERALVEHLLGLIGFTTAHYPIREDVVEYEGGKMGSISMGDDPNLYDGDLVQVEYVDSDGTPVVITLTKDSNGKLLDLDFWKVDFSKLITYPQPHQVSVRSLDAGI